MARIVILPYGGSRIFYRLLNTLIVIFFIFIWYLIIQNQEVFNRNFIDSAPTDSDKSEVSGPVKGQTTQPANDNFQGSVEEVKAESDEGQVMPEGINHSVDKVENSSEPPPASRKVTQVIATKPFDIWQRFEDRNTLIKDCCDLDNNPNFRQSNMYYFPKLEATWMPLYGASSTLWKNYFIDRYGRKRRVNGDQYSIVNLGKFLLRISTAKKGKGRKTRKMPIEPDDSLRFTIIRHPLSRLIAHFQKPQLDHGELVALKDEWVRPSIILGRNDPSWTDEEKANFILELDLWIDGKLTPEQSPNNTLLSTPTFSEFVRFIIYAADKGDKRAYSVHWRPISEWLDICQNDIDIIVKQENFKSEIPVLLEEIGLLSEEVYFLENADEANDVNIEEFMGQLSRGDQERINDFYGMDYEYFEYLDIFVDNDSDLQK